MVERRRSESSPTLGQAVKQLTDFLKVDQALSGIDSDIAHDVRVMAWARQAETPGPYGDLIAGLCGTVLMADEILHAPEDNGNRDLARSYFEPVQDPGARWLLTRIFLARASEELPEWVTERHPAYEAEDVAREVVGPSGSMSPGFKTLTPERVVEAILTRKLSLVSTYANLVAPAYH